MPASPITHPSDEVLLALGGGKLDDAIASTVLAHLDACPDCCRRATSLSGDDLLRRVRAARSRWPGTVSPVSMPVQVATTADASDVPPELRGHDQYEISRELGRGGMGVVYLARHRLTDRPEVLKVLSQHLVGQAGVADRFLREIRLAARLSHPNIVTVYSAQRIGGLLVLAMEYVEGEDLARVVQTRGPLPVTEACLYAAQAALGLQHAFEKGLVHRDVKPHNLILTRQGNRPLVKVLDFGLAKATREKDASSASTGSDRTEAGMALGTPAYAAPEQTLDAAKADVRADVYSLGCTLYFLLAGRPPFQADSLFALLYAHQSKEAEPVSEHRKEVPAELAAVVAKMMEKDPARRFQTPVEVARALAPFAKKAGPVAPVPRTIGRTEAASDTVASPASALENTAVASAPRLAARRGARRWWVVAAAAALLLIGLVGLWAGGVFRQKTKEGVLVVEVNEPDFEVYVDGDRVKVTWENGGKTAVIRHEPGTRKVEVKKDGVTVRGEEVELHDGKRLVVRVRIPPHEPKEKEPPPAPAPLPAGYDLTGGFGATYVGPDRTLVLLRRAEVGQKATAVQVFDLATGLQISWPLEHPRPVAGWSFSPDGKRVVMGCEDGTVQVWEADTGKKLTAVKHDDRVGWVSFSPDGKRLVTGSRDRTVRVWDADTGKPISPPLVHDSWASRVCFSPDGGRVITGPHGTVAQVWDAVSGKKLTPPLKHADTVSDVKFSPDGKRVATACKDGKARIWDASTGERIGADLGHGEQVNRVVFSPDGKLVVTASDDRTARVWDGRTGKPVSPPLRHSDRVAWANFSPDGARVVTASNDKSAVIWDAVSGKPLTPPMMHDKPCLHACFSPDGKRVVSTGADGTRRGWDATTGRQIQTAPVVVATYAHRIDKGTEGRHRYYSNGRIDAPDANATWSVRGRTLTLRWYQDGAPGGAWVDVCTLSPDGTTYSGLNQRKLPTSGRHVSGVNLVKDWPPYLK